MSNVERASRQRPVAEQCAPRNESIPQVGKWIWLWHLHDREHYRAHVDDIIMEPESRGQRFTVSLSYDSSHGGGLERNVSSWDIKRVTVAQGLAREVDGACSVTDHWRTWFYDDKQVVGAATSETVARAPRRRQQHCVPQRRWLELFAGKGIISEAAQAVGGAFTHMVDILPPSKPGTPLSAYTTADLSNQQTLSGLLKEHHTAIWAAPPCTTGSKEAFAKHGRSPDHPQGKTLEAHEANRLIKMLLEQLEQVLQREPDTVIYVETSGDNYLARLPVVKKLTQRMGLRQVQLSQCCFGGDMQKHHILWTNCKVAIRELENNGYVCGNGQLGCQHVRRVGKHPERANGSNAVRSGAYPLPMAETIVRWTDAELRERLLSQRSRRQGGGEVPAPTAHGIFVEMHDTESRLDTEEEEEGEEREGDEEGEGVLESEGEGAAEGEIEAEAKDDFEDVVEDEVEVEFDDDVEDGVSFEDDDGLMDGPEGQDEDENRIDDGEGSEGNEKGLEGDPTPRKKRRRKTPFLGLYRPSQVRRRLEQRRARQEAAANGQLEEEPHEQEEAANGQPEEEPRERPPVVCKKQRRRSPFLGLYSPSTVKRRKTKRAENAAA